MKPTRLALSATLPVVLSVAVLTAAQSGVPAAPSGTAGRDPVLWARALRLHRAATVVDGHSDVTSRLLDEGFDMEARAKDGHQDIPRMREGGLDVQFFSIYVDRDYVASGGAMRRAMDMIGVVYDQAARHPESLEIAYSVADVRRIVKKGRIAALMGIEGGHAIENSIYALGLFHRLGVRYMTLTHTNTNDWADSSGSFMSPGGDTPRWGGLNDFGREVVFEMNRLGIVVDISHVSDETFADVIEATKSPVMASHSSARALCAQKRNLTDDQLRAIARNGGVVMVNFFETFLDQRHVELLNRYLPERDAIRGRLANDPKEMAKALDAFDAAHPLPRTPLSVLIDHIDHIAKVAGVDHVGLGSDFDGGVTLPEGMRDCADLPVITYELLRRGYSEADIRKVLGENALRVLAECERVAAGLQRTQPGPRRVFLKRAG